MTKKLTKKDIEQNPILKGFEPGQKIEIKEVQGTKSRSSSLGNDEEPPGIVGPRPDDRRP